MNRPKALNALCADLMTEVGKAIESFEFDENIGAIILTGSERAFAAGRVEILLNLKPPSLN